MAIRDIFKVSRKTFFNPRAWLGYDALKDQTQTITSLLKDAATVEKPERTETFSAALKRLELDQKDVQLTAKLYLIYALFFLTLGVLDFVYGLYLLFHHGSFAGLLLAFSVCVLLLTQAFKYHFWHFQIKHHKLGCTFQEWYQGKVKPSRGGASS